MTTILDPITKAVNDTAATLLDQQVPAKLAGAVNSLVNAGFDSVTQVLTVVRDLTAPSPTPGP
ncbi:MAG TPA: hypothetical protein VFA03_08615 [Acetobacteraceae bacterium]|nr:hypothetical protein [Acetobacteraceae bacterium]